MISIWSILIKEQQKIIIFITNKLKVSRVFILVSANHQTF